MQILHNPYVHMPGGLRAPAAASAPDSHQNRGANFSEEIAEGVDLESNPSRDFS